MICGGFSESAGKCLEVQDVDGNVFCQVLDLWCGKEDGLEKDLSEVQQLASVADRFQMTEVVSALEMAMIEQLCVEICGEMLAWSRWVGLKRLEKVARKLALERFEDVATTAAFSRIDEEALGSLLDDGGLTARNEEAVWEALVRWIKADTGLLRGQGLVGKIRFPLMDAGFLSSRAARLLPEEHADWIEGLVAEALQAKATRSDDAPFIPRLLGPQAQVRRAGVGVRWREYLEGGEIRLSGHSEDVRAIAECGARVCSGAQDGTIRVWNRATLGLERILRAGESESPEEGRAETGLDPVNALVAWRGRAISGHDSGALWAWDVLSGLCRAVLGRHTRVVTSLAVCGSRLVSGSWDRSVKVWVAEPGGDHDHTTWAACELTLLGHSDWVRSLATWRDKAISGSGDEIRVWDLGVGALDATLESRGGTVRGLVVHGDVLLSASGDGTIRMWAVGTWVALRTVAAYDSEAGRGPVYCLAVSGSKLVSGSDGGVRIWDLESLDYEHTLRQPALHTALALAAVGGEVWAGVSGSVVVWGR